MTGPLLFALAELKNAVNALDPSKSYAEMLPQFEDVPVALTHAKVEKASLENASRPIFSLPPEITSHILGIGRKTHDAANGDKTLFSLRVSHVCRAWREITISMPTFWDTLTSTPFRSQLFHEMVVQRSQTSTLAIFIGAEGASNAKVHICLCHLHFLYHIDGGFCTLQPPMSWFA